jgi:hypothetical protein
VGIVCFRPAMQKGQVGPTVLESSHSFFYSIDVPNDDGPTMEHRLRQAFPMLAWVDRAENWDKIRLQGVSAEKPPRISISVSRKESPGPFWLTINLQQSGSTAAAGLLALDELHLNLRDQVIAALL